MTGTKIFYFVPENNKPSWGAGMLYYHVWLLRKNNIDAYVLHEKKSFRLSWLSLDVPICYLNDGLQINQNEVLVIPEYFADLQQLKTFNCKKIVFVQNAYYIFDGLKNNCIYEDLGISHIFYYMPHLEKILKQIFSLPLYEMPPFIAPYYFTELTNKRKRRIILYPKFASRDYDILKRIVKQKLDLEPKTKLQRLLGTKKEWEIIELKDKKHYEVAKEMHEAAFFISINTTEAFNSAVPEAMAAGCINICYEAVGPSDFLENNMNAYVFPNNHIFPLAEKVISLIQQYDNIQDELKMIRTNAYQTADKYKIENLEKALVPFFSQISQTAGGKMHNKLL